MLDVATVLLALLAVLVGPHWLLRCLGRADECDTNGDPHGAFAWTLAAVLGAYAVGLSLLVLVIEAARQTLRA
ncbi:MAG: hypothetical protein RMK01_03475 [Thermomicrobium sp.]|nr:hypothetical protein [Thermomicrobium sp.]MDW8059114.1 hypothetical protein [Thermomicrobium sp.]